jgi:mono/diheme cytochrome c family protein
MTSRAAARGQTGAAAPALLAALASLAAAAPARAGAEQDYMLYCRGCHGADAEGVPGKIPPLAAALARFMRAPEGRNYVLRVPGAANSALTDAQLAGVLNWLAARYPAADAPQVAPFTVEEVTRMRHTPLADVLATRREVVRALAASGAAPAAQY